MVTNRSDAYRVARRRMGQLPRTFGKPVLLVDLLCEDIGDSLIQAFQEPNQLNGHIVDILMMLFG